MLKRILNQSIHHNTLGERLYTTKPRKPPKPTIQQTQPAFQYKGFQIINVS